MQQAFASTDAVVEKMLSSLGSQSGIRILEFAAGTGILKDVSDERGSFVLVEDDSDAIEAMKGVSSRDNAQWVRCPPWNVEVPDCSIGAVLIAQNAIRRLSPSSYCFSEAHRLLGPGGRLLTVLDDFDDADETPSVPSWRRWFDPHAIEMTLHRTSSDPVLVTSVLSGHPPGFHKYDFVCSVPPIARVTHIMFGLGFEVSKPVRIEPEGIPASRDRPIVLMEATKRNTAPPVKYMQARDTYDELADHYDDFVGGAEYRVPAWLIGEIKGKYGTDGRKAPRAVLDMGCGNGYLGRRFAQANALKARFFGCDFSRQMVEQCRNLGGYEAALTYDLNHGVPIVESQLFDVVLACGCLEFLESCQEVIGGIYRVLKTGGSALLTFEHRPPTGRSDAASGDGSSRRLAARAYSIEEVETLLTSHGLTIRSMQTDIGYRSPTTGGNVPYIFVHAERRS